MGMDESQRDLRARNSPRRLVRADLRLRVRGLQHQDGVQGTRDNGAVNYGCDESGGVPPEEVECAIIEMLSIEESWPPLWKSEKDRRLF